MASDRNLHIYFLLDRSGSMQSMASDVIGGFNTFLASQQADGPDALFTLVQFDSQDPHEMLTDAVPISEIIPLDATQFRPRGSTPLYDAMGRLIADATIRAEAAHGGQTGEEILFVTFTDGLENASHEYTQRMIFDLVKKREDRGWTFVFLGANQDSYAQGGQIGYSASNIQNFVADAPGSFAAFSSLSDSTSRRRAAMRSGAHYDSRDFFEGDKEAEDDLRSRSEGDLLPDANALISLMDDLAAQLGAQVKVSATGKRYRGPGQSYIGVYRSSRRIEFGLKLLRAAGHELLAEDLVRRMQDWIGRPLPSGDFPSFRCARVLADWERVASEIIRPFLAAGRPHS